MRRVEILAITIFMLSHILLILSLISFEENSCLWYVAWLTGVIGVALNIFLGEKILNNWVFVLLILSGIMWLVPFLLITYFGIPCLAIYIVVNIYMYLKIWNKSKLNGNIT